MERLEILEETLLVSLAPLSSRPASSVRFLYPKMIDTFAAHSRALLRLTALAFQYFLALGGIRDTSTGSNSNFGSSASGAKYALVVLSQFLSSRSGKSGL